MARKQEEQERQAAQAMTDPRQGDGASLVDALQTLIADMTRASTDAEAEAGLKRLKQIRASFVGTAGRGGAAARRDAEALISWVELHLERLRRQLARKRRAQEGEVIRKLAAQREAEGPSLLPTELVDAVVHSTVEAEKDKTEAVRPSRPAAPEDRTPERKRPRRQATDPRRADKKPEEEKQEPKQSAQAPQTVWTKNELLAAHLAASVREDPQFFEKLRRTAKRKGPNDKARNAAPADVRLETVRDVGMRLVNLELQVRALARGAERGEPVSALLRSAAGAIQSFFRDFQTAGKAKPELAEEYERLFGGCAEQLSAMKPEKGREILEQCQAEREPCEQALSGPETPQLVLKRDDWQQN